MKTGMVRMMVSCSSGGRPRKLRLSMMNPMDSTKPRASASSLWNCSAGTVPLLGT
jgi:hypothetical protein